MNTTENLISTIKCHAQMVGSGCFIIVSTDPPEFWRDHLRVLNMFCF
jgi:hypothetical protein